MFNTDNMSLETLKTMVSIIRVVMFIPGMFPLYFLYIHWSSDWFLRNEIDVDSQPTTEFLMTLIMVIYIPFQLIGFLVGYAIMTAPS